MSHYSSLLSIFRDSVDKRPHIGLLLPFPIESFRAAAMSASFVRMWGVSPCAIGVRATPDGLAPGSCKFLQNLNVPRLDYANISTRVCKRTLATLSLFQADTCSNILRFPGSQLFQMCLNPSAVRLTAGDWRDSDYEATVLARHTLWPCRFGIGDVCLIAMRTDSIEGGG